MSKRSIEERVAEKEKQLEVALQKVQQYKNQLRDLNNRKSDEERKKRTHQLIVCGAEIASLYGHTLSTDEVHTLVNFLRQKKEEGVFSIEETKFEKLEAREETQEETEEQEDAFGFGGMFNL